MKNKIETCLGLFNSMILSGENHSEQSKQCYADAKKELAELKTALTWHKIESVEDLPTKEDLPCLMVSKEGVTDISFAIDFPEACANFYIFWIKIPPFEVENETM